MASVVTDLTDWFGVTDSKAPQRGVNALRDGMNSANQQYTQGMANALQPHGAAADIYNPLNNLDTFTQGITDAEDKINEGSRLGTVGATQEYLNPMMNQMMDAATKRVQAGGGAAARSSAMNNAIADRVAGMAGDMWNTATQQRQGDSGIQTGAGKTTADIYNMALQNWNRPSDIMTQGKMDHAGTMYNANTAGAQGAGQQAGTKTSVL